MGYLTTVPGLKLPQTALRVLSSVCQSVVLGSVANQTIFSASTSGITRTSGDTGQLFMGSTGIWVEPMKGSRASQHYFVATASWNI